MKPKTIQDVVSGLERKEHLAILSTEIDIHTMKLKEHRTPKDWIKYGHNTDILTGVEVDENNMLQEAIKQFKKDPSYDTLPTLYLEDYLFPELIDVIKTAILNGEVLKLKGE